MKIELNLRKRQNIISVFLSFCADAFISSRSAFEIEHEMWEDCFNYQREKSEPKWRQAEWRGKKGPLLWIRWVFAYQMKSGAKKIQLSMEMSIHIRQKKIWTYKMVFLGYFFSCVLWILLHIIILASLA